MLSQEAHKFPTRALAGVLPIAPAADPDRAATRRLLKAPAGMLSLALVLGGAALVWQDARHEISADDYRALASVAARSCHGAADLRERMVRGPIRNSDRMGVQLHLQALARAGTAPAARRGCAS